MKTVLKKGDILVGYRGTEVEFYEVVRVTPKTVLLVSIQKKLLDVNGIEYTAVPIPGREKKRPSDAGSSPPDYRRFRDAASLIPSLCFSGMVAPDGGQWIGKGGKNRCVNWRSSQSNFYVNMYFMI